MKKSITRNLIFLCFILLGVNKIQAQEIQRCASEVIFQKRYQSDEIFRKSYDRLEKEIEGFIQRKPLMKTSEDTAIIIPVVFHVVYNNQTQNIDERLIHEQIEILNEDFNAQNGDISTVPSPFKPLIGRFKVRFELANRDPNGQVTNGITRTHTDTLGFSIGNDFIKHSSRGGKNAWDTKSYLNVWICNLLNNYLGYSTFPTDAGKPDDGFVLKYTNVGYGFSNSAPYDLGRTATHEIGHYFNLKHIWGDKDDCSTDDGVSDTPLQAAATRGDPSFPKYDQCTGSYPGIMFMNFMDYSNDKSLLMFTQGQVNRMEATIMGPRASLLTSKGYVKSTDIALDKIVTPLSAECAQTLTPAVILKVIGAKEISSIKISMAVDQQVVSNLTKDVYLEIGDTMIFNFPSRTFSPGSHEISFRIEEVNGKVGDKDLTNNTLTKTFNVGLPSVETPLHEDFEIENIQLDGFEIENPDNGITWQRAPESISKTGDYSYFIDNYHYRPDSITGHSGQKDDIILPDLDFRNLDNAWLKFYLAAAQFRPIGSTEPNPTWDSLQVLVSTDCGKSYQVVYNKYALTLVTVLDPVLEPFVPNLNQWRLDSINLKSFAGNDHVRIKIRNISWFQNNIYLDNLEVAGDQLVTSIRDKKSSDKVLIYPNPTQGDIVIKADRGATTIKEVFWSNNLGQVIDVQRRSTPNGLMSFDLYAFPSGIYFAKIIWSDGSVVTQKVWKK